MLDTEREKKIQELIDESPKILLRGSDEGPIVRIPFNIPQLDKLTGGGIPKKRLSILTGPEGSGKSYLAMHIAASVQKAGGLVAWFDTEISWDSEWMTRCGLDPKNVILSQESAGESLFDTMRALMRASVDLIVLDSIAGVIPTVLSEEGFDYNPVAWQARFINQSLPRLIAELKNGTALLFINQRRESLGPVSLDAMPGGIAQKFFAHFILQVRRSGWIEENKEKVGFDIEVRCRKTKVGGVPFGSCVIPFRLSGGIDLIETYIREALTLGIIKQAKAWYTIEEHKELGLNNVKKYLLENVNVWLRLKEIVDKKGMNTTVKIEEVLA